MCRAALYSGQDKLLARVGAEMREMRLESLRLLPNNREEAAAKSSLGKKSFVLKLCSLPSDVTLQVFKTR